MTERAERIARRVAHLTGRPMHPAAAAAALREAVTWVRPHGNITDTPVQRGVVVASDELDRIADEVAVLPAGDTAVSAGQWGVYHATVLADYAMRELDNAKLLQEWALELSGDEGVMRVREANRRVAIATAGLHAAEDELTRAQQRAGGAVTAKAERHAEGVRDSDTPLRGGQAPDNVVEGK